MKDNKLIAEFMGMKYGDPNDNSVMIQTTPQGNEVVPINSMKYHSSWDWLMPVVGKISRDEKFIENEYREYLLDIVPYGRIQDVFEAVVHFIKDYNTKKTDYLYLVVSSIMTRYGSLDNLKCQLREDSDVAYVNIADDTNMVVNEHEVEDIINQLIR